MSAPIETSPDRRDVLIWTSPLPRAPGPDLIERFGTYPLDFHHGALLAGFEIVCGDTLPRLCRAVLAARRQGRRVLIFVYSLRPYDVLALTLFAGQVPAVVYYQNIDPDRMPWPKRLPVAYALARARLVLAQDALRLARFRRELGARRTRFFPWLVDDVFFQPRPGVARTPMLFVPGDRGRLDEVVMEIARRSGRRLVRVSRYFPEPVLAAYQACPHIDLRYFVRWDELLDLYQEASVVLNVTDDAQTSAGMTSFLEGLALNALVITPAGHSSAGYEFEDGSRPYLTIAQPRDVDAWLEAIALADRHPRQWPEGRAPRDLFLKMSGLGATSRRWRELFQDATA